MPDRPAGERSIAVSSVAFLRSFKVRSAAAWYHESENAILWPLPTPGEMGEGLEAAREGVRRVALS